LVLFSNVIFQHCPPDHGIHLSADVTAPAVFAAAGESRCGVVVAAGGAVLAGVSLAVVLVDFAFGADVSQLALAFWEFPEKRRAAVSVLLVTFDIADAVLTTSSGEEVIAFAEEAPLLLVAEAPTLTGVRAAGRGSMLACDT
jgi:hypothetical protein